MVSFLFVLGTDDPSKATRCMQLAKVAAESGHQTDVFLVDDGVIFAKKELEFSKNSQWHQEPLAFFLLSSCFFLLVPIVFLN